MFKRLIMKYLYILTCVVVFISCNKKRESKFKKSVQKKNIVIYFDKRSYKKDTLFLNNGKSFSLKITPSLTYTKKYPYEKTNVSLNNINTVDTLIITTDKKIIFEHRYHYYYYSSYIFEAGDTIKFNYVNDAPYCLVLNKKKFINQFNFEVDHNLSNKIYKSNFQFYDENKKFRNEKQKKLYLDRLKNNRVKQLSYLDSLYKNNNFSKQYYSFLKRKINYQVNNLTNFSKLGKDSFDLKNDSLLSVSSYRHFLTYYCNQKFKPPIIKNGYKNMINSKVVFDSIKNSSIFSIKNKNYLLYHYLKDIANNFSIDDFNVYNNKFNKQVKDSVLKKQLNRKYMVDLLPLKNEAKKVYTINPKKEKQTLDSIIKKNKGKVIYIDFWASWCTPCRDAIKPSFELQKHYKNKDFIYIYLSIDKNYSEWENASKQEKLTFNNYNLLTINYPKAKFYKDLDLKTIPRYILYDKEGNLVHINAPGPKGKEIRNLIDKYL